MATDVFNFLLPQLKPKITTKSPVTDGYEVTNLISDENIKLSKGFLAYTAIRAPVDVDVELICSVNLHYIFIWSTNGSQRTTAIEILAQKYGGDITICKIYFNEDGIAIYNRKYYCDESKLNVPFNFKRDFFRTKQFNVISSVEKLRIRILRTDNSVPCIGKIEIWGRVADTCSETTKQTIKCLVSKKMSQHSSIDFDKASSSRPCVIDDQLDIPEEFVDPITCDIMSLPMTLPCGKTVDQSTLDKHKENEAMWGRNMSDPFTGKIFTLSHRPVLNAALKNRIDQFLFENAHRKETQSIARTVGNVQHFKRSNLKSAEFVNEANKKRQKTEYLSGNSSKEITLDDIIQNAYEKYDIQRFSAEIKTEPVKTLCIICDNVNNMYTLPCNHFICRICLTNVNFTINKCKICSKTFSKSEVKKYHAV